MAKTKKTKKTKTLSGLTKKDLKKLEKQRARRAIPLTFDEKLARLVIWYGVQEDKLIHVDQVFNGTWERDHDHSVDEIIVLLPKLLERFDDVWNRRRKPNVWSDEMFAHLIGFTDTIPVELAAMVARQVDSTDFQLRNSPLGLRRVVIAEATLNSPAFYYWTFKEESNG